MIDESINKIYEDNKTILIIGMARCGKTTKLLQTIKELEGKRKPPLVIFPAYHKHGVHELSQCDVELYLHHYQPKTPVEEIENVFIKALSEGKDIYIDELMNDGLKEKLIKIYFSQTCISKSKLFVTLQGIVDVQDKSILKLFDIVLQGKTSRTNVLFEQFKINPLNLDTFIYLGVGEFIAVKTKEDEAEHTIKEITEVKDCPLLFKDEGGVIVGIGGTSGGEANDAKSTRLDGTSSLPDNQVDMNQNKNMEIK